MNDPAPQTDALSPQPAAEPSDELETLRAQLLRCQSQLAERESDFQQLQQTVRELGTPVLPIHDRVLVLPLIGHLDGARGAHLMEDLLRAIQTHQADVVLLDITGVSLVDTSVANSLIQVTRAAALLGSTTILVGVSAAVSRTLVQLGIDLAQVSTQRDLQAGIALALRLRGYAIVRSRPEVDWLSEFDRDPR